MHNISREALLAKWLDRTMSTQERTQFEKLYAEDADFAAQVETANQVAMMAEHFEQVDVPAWNVNATFDRPASRKWWQWQGLSALSLATSALAILMVVSGFQIHSRDGEISLGFGVGAPDKAEIAAMVDEKLNDYQVANQAMFGKYIDAIAAQQKESSAQLTQYLLLSSRQERREDFAEFVKFINLQRDDDQRFMARQINHLQQDISSLQSSYGSAEPIPE